MLAHCKTGHKLMSLVLQGAIAGGSLATAFSVWMVVGNFLYDPHDQPLPTRVDMCNSTSPNGFYVNGNVSDDGFTDYTSAAFADVTANTFHSTETLSTALLQQTTSSITLLVTALVSKCCRLSSDHITLTCSPYNA